MACHIHCMYWAWQSWSREYVNHLSNHLHFNVWVHKFMTVKMFSKTKYRWYAKPLFCNIFFYPILWEIASFISGQGPHGFLIFKKLRLLTSLSSCNLQLANKNCETLLCVHLHNFKHSHVGWKKITKLCGRI